MNILANKIGEKIFFYLFQSSRRNYKMTLKANTLIGMLNLDACQLR